MQKASMTIDGSYAVSRTPGSSEWDRAQYLRDQPGSKQKIVIKWETGPWAGEERTVALGSVICDWRQVKLERAHRDRELALHRDRDNYSTEDVGAARSLAEHLGLDRSVNHRSGGWNVDLAKLRPLWTAAGLPGDPREEDELGYDDNLSFGTLIRFGKAYAMTNPTAVAQMVVQAWERWGDDLRKTLRDRGKPMFVNGDQELLLQWAGRDADWAARYEAALKPEETLQIELADLREENERLRAGLTAALDSMGSMSFIADRLKKEWRDG